MNGCPKKMVYKPWVFFFSQKKISGLYFQHLEEMCFLFFFFLLKSSWKWPRAASQPCPSQLRLPSAALRAVALLQPVEVTAGTEMRMLSRQRSNGSCIFDRRKVWSATLKWVPKSSGRREPTPRIPELLSSPPSSPASCEPLVETSSYLRKKKIHGWIQLMHL